MVIILFVYSIICVGCFIYWYKKDRNEGIFKLVFSLFIPGLGLVYVILMDIINHNRLENKYFTPEIKNDCEFNDNRFLGQLAADEGNVVPVEEALLLNSNKIKRRLMIDIIKKDVNKYIPVLKKALKDKDSETSHYAAAAIIEIKSTFTTRFHDLYRKYRMDEKNSFVLKKFRNFLKEYLSSGLLDDESKKTYIDIYSVVLKNCIGYIFDNYEYYIDVIELELERKKYLVAKKYCDDFYKRFNNYEMPYILYIKYYYEVNDYKNLYRMLGLLEKSNISLTSKTAKIVRFWRGNIENKDIYQKNQSIARISM